MTLTIHAVGDLGLIGSILERCRRGDGGYPFAGVREELARADIRFGNLEVPFLPEGRRSEKPAVPDSFVSRAEACPRLRAAGFDVVSLANNHTMDHGAVGLRTTLDALRAQGIRSVGAGENLAEARRPAVLARGGQRVGFLAYAVARGSWATEDRPGVAPMLDDVIAADLRSLREQVEILVLSLHFGLMYTDYPQVADQRRLRGWIERGADLIVGHHPHVLQGVEEHGGGLIAYSLGDFVFDPRAGNVVAAQFLERRAQSMILESHWTGRRLRGWSAIPVLIGDDLAPYVPAGERRDRIAARIGSLSAPLRGDGLARLDVDAHIGARLVRYEVDGLIDLARKGRFASLLRTLARVRMRHVRFLWGWARARMRAALARGGPPASAA